jgi:hypothetical protein
VELEFLPPYRPDPEEQVDPILFASNVRRVMAASLGVQLCDLRSASAAVALSLAI